MFTVALIGEDGAGKTTVAKRLVQSLPWPSRYLYMGLSVLTSNMPLPTTLVARYIKLLSHRIKGGKSGQTHISRETKKRGNLWLMIRFINRMAEIWWRQLISWSYQLQGFVVVYDRHFLFETAIDDKAEESKEKVFDRLEYWIVNKAYPKPDLVIVLDAPAKVLYTRKGEGTIEYLKKRKELTQKKGEDVQHLAIVDASQPLEQVIADVTQHIVEFKASGKVNSTSQVSVNNNR